MLPFVVIAGRPNVGKSTLFNRLIGKNKALTHDRPGVTRDRIYGEVRRGGTPFALVDTGGLILDADEGIEKEILAQAQEAIEAADLVLLVVDGREGINPLDEQLAEMLRQSNKPIHLVVNKVDGLEKEDALVPEFYELGFDLTPVSAAHGHNITGLIEEIRAKLPPIEREQEVQDKAPGLRLSLLGRPNVGKSSMINALVGENRLIVSPVAGTTRDSVDVTLEKDGKLYTFVDTAGVRKKRRIRDSLEQFSVLRALRSSKRAQVVLLVLDALEGVLAQDKKLLSFLDREKTPFIVVVNKIDLIPRSKLAQLKEYFRQELRFCSHAPIVYTSTISKAGLGSLLPLAENLWAECQKRVTTGLLNRLIKEATYRHQPPLIKGKRAKFYYMTQAGVCPPEFVFFVNNKELVKPTYVRYLERQIRKLFGLNMAPIRMYFRDKG
ncbi:ribosome biogenesis GTPase Der [Desulfohalobiaceae bacterium Ax17]|uniref:ribosome biogenesis GTPase Der n=1 Tax=Desulfovulcanus ferrireducens TaxID=2831190 RepID=UPI00207B9E50|nr:ribosome biogenesis GTPase Der [Desulfovulcanus ferrireducens]